MLRLLIDQDLDQVILRGLLLRVPNLDVITAHQAGLSDASDPDLLAWAAEQKRIVVTHDRRMMPYHAATRIDSEEGIAGLIIVSRRLPVSQVIGDLEISHFSKGTKARKDSHARHDRVNVIWQTFGRLRLRFIQSVQRNISQIDHLRKTLT